VGNGPEHEVGAYNSVSYTYINDDRLIRVTSPGNAYDLAYDALGRCVKRTLNGATTYYIYDGEKPIVEYTSAGTIVARNVYGKWIDEILMRTDTTVNGGQPFYYHQDRNQNVTHLTSAAGTVIEKYKYDAFGKPTIYAPNGTERTTSLFKNRFLFTGREYAATFGFYEYRARAYNPTLGRFMSEDPKGFDAGDYNLFRYCHNDPLDRTDPMGLFDWVFSDDYPEKGPGGREAFTRGMQTLGSKAKGAEILAREPNRTFVIKPTTGNQVTQWRRGTNDMYFNPKDPLFLDPKSRRDFSTNPKELPPTNDKGRAAIQAHEFGHATTRGDKGRDDIYPGGRNVRLNENPVRREQGIPERETYAGRPLGGKIPGTAIDRAIDTGQAPIQPQMDAAQIDNQQGDVPDFGMLGGGPLGLGGPPRSPSR